MANGTPHLLIAVDGSPSAATTVRVAAGLFPGARATVATVASEPTVHVGTAGPMVPGFSPDATQRAIGELAAEAKRQAADIAEQAAEQARTLGLEAEPATVPPAGAAWAALLDATRRTGADVLVCGTRGRGAFARALLGSTSSSLLHHTDVPLLVVPDGHGALDGPMAVAYDGSDGAKRAIEVAGRLMAGRATVVVHAWEPVVQRSLTARAFAGGGPVDHLHDTVWGLQQAIIDHAGTTTEDGLAAARAAGLEAVGETVESHDGLWRTVAATARVHGASVIAVGARGRGAGRAARHRAGGAGRVQNAELPVLVVPGAPEVDG